MSDAWSALVRAGVRAAQQAHTVVILGELGTGKTTLLRLLAGETRAAGISPLSAGHLDLSEAGDDESLSAGVYTVHSSAAPVLGTLPFAFPPVMRPPGGEARAALSRVASSIFVITLDWSEPWTFAVQLGTWLPAIARIVSGAYADEDEVAEALRVDMQIRLLESFRAGNADPSLPLSPGALDENLGVPMAIVLTKSDALDDRRVLSESQVDYVQQVVRTIALRFGAAVFSVSHSTPMDGIRAYLRSRLFARPAPAAEASVVDAATLAVPSGWDSWTQIRASNEAFDCARIIDAWQAGPHAFAEEYAAHVPDPHAAVMAGASAHAALPDLSLIHI